VLVCLSNKFIGFNNSYFICAVPTKSVYIFFVYICISRKLCSISFKPCKNISAIRFCFHKRVYYFPACINAIVR